MSSGVHFGANTNKKENKKENVFQEIKVDILLTSCDLCLLLFICDYLTPHNLAVLSLCPNSRGLSQRCPSLCPQPSFDLRGHLL